LQEYAPGHGWGDITEPSGEIPTVDECREHFKPGCHYRLMAKATEDSEDAKIKGGTFVGMVWKYYEPLPGGVVAVKEKPKAPEKPSKPKDATAWMQEYAGDVRRTLEPIKDISLALAELRESLYPEGSQPGQSAGENYEVPALEYEGKAPWFMHPSVVKVWGDQIKSVIEYGANRLEGILGKPPTEGPSPIEKEEEFALPSIDKYAKPKAPEVPAGLEERELEERVEGEEAIEEEVEEEFIEETETVPSLIEKEKVEGIALDRPCAHCGKVVPLLPSGICEKCAKKLAKEGEEHEKELEEESEAEVEEEEASG